MFNSLFSLPQYHMVLVNVLSLSILSFLLLANHYFWPKKKIDFLLLTFLFSIPPIISIFRSGTYESGDLSLHATRLMAFWESISQGEIIPRWAGSLNAGFGYPLFQFIYPLPYYIASIWHYVGFGFIDSVKLTITLSYISSGLIVYLLSRKHVSNLSAFFSAILYLFTPYHLVDLHFRVAFGEIVAFTFLPLTLLTGANYISSKKQKWFVFSALSFALLILSHQAIALISPIIIVSYWWVISKNYGWKKQISLIIKPILLGLILAAFYWLPLMLERKYTLGDIFSQSVLFQSFWEYIYSPWRFGFLFQGPNGELSFAIGYAHLFVIFAGIFIVTFRKAQQKRLLSLWLSLLLIFFYLTQSISKPVWDLLPILKNFQFSYRLLLPITLCTAMVGGLVSEQIVKQKKLIYILIFLTIISSSLNWGNRRNIPQIDDNYLRNDLPLATLNGEGLDAAATKWSIVASPWQRQPIEKLIKSNENIVKYNEIVNLNNHKIIDIEATQPTLILVNLTYFPGWQVWINNERKPILYELKNHYGLIGFHIPDGYSEIEILFKDTLIRRLADYISLGGGFVILWLFLKAIIFRK